MANVLNRSTLEYLGSVHTPDYPVGQWVINPDMSAVTGLPRKYWKLSGDIVTAMDATEQAAADAIEQAAIHVQNRSEALSELTHKTHIGVRIRELIEQYNRRDNYNIRRIIELQDMVTSLVVAITSSTGNAQAIRYAVALIDISHRATATQTRGEAIQAYKDDINAGGAD